MYHNKVEICGVNTSKLKMLTDEEKNALLLRVKQGDHAARQAMIDGNLRLVLSIIQRFTNRGEDMDDLFQVGCIGLIKAIDNFNTDLDVKFSTYAVPMNILCGKENDFSCVKDLCERYRQKKEPFFRRVPFSYCFLRNGNRCRFFHR